MTIRATHRWTQPPLLDVGYPFVTADLTVHYDGAAGSVTTGYRLRDGMTGEPIELGAVTGASPLAVALPRLDRELLALHELAMRRLSPF